ncbi:FAD-dependent monooxygenase [Sphingomonas cavernae]|uniref:Monooxygenase, FAD/NAD(P)-binding domain protein n=1 Tax=Sphingomonas cavernae TaxID=2320861 RepID=A0A418WJT4_9SPHN|nr:FAD-dependent monooxygenase [Sphingomonas cavernae]RJF90275.1 monooxygenase, FAD/NAD(P)-binding domain protein [Sphingomonas cavernae]
MRIAVLGGGPGGLYFARLVRRAWPDWPVDVFEQNPHDATFGFGVTLGGAALGRITDADPELVGRIAKASVFNNRQNIDLNGSEILLEYEVEGASIERLTLLTLMQELCEAVGVNIRYNQRVASTSELSGYDLIIGADGANSMARQERAAAFGANSRVLNNRFAWYGVRKKLEPNALVFRSAFGGALVAHYYAYTPEMSTFVAEADEAAWVNGGLGDMTDDQRRSIFEELFAPQLEGASLIENNSIYRQFAAVSVDRWVDGNVVLIGDAQRVAHPSIGSGTRLAMDDAQALFDALREQTELPAALELFERRRRPVRERFAEAAQRSFDWYERVGEVMQKLPIDFVYDFLTRTGRIDDTRLISYVPDFATLYAKQRGFDVPLRQPRGR